MRQKNDQDARALALTAQALAHAHHLLQDAGHRAGGSTPSPENRRILERIYKLENAVLRLTKFTARQRDKADGY